MTESFIANPPEVTPKTFSAFGIQITSQLGYAYEVIEMINFARETVKRNVNYFVTHAIHDSEAGICRFEMLDTLRMGDPVTCQIELAAHFTISRYEWFGSDEDGLPSLPK